MRILFFLRASYGLLRRVCWEKQCDAKIKSPNRVSYLSAAGLLYSERCTRSQRGRNLHTRNSAMATPHSPRRCFCQRRRSYKQMVQDVAENLGSEDVQKIVFHHDLPAEFNGKTALTALRQLEMQGQFSESDTEHLESLLKGIHRYDLINKHVVHYRRNYCGCEDSYGARGVFCV